MPVFLVLVACSLLGILGNLWEGWVIARIWSWFVVPNFGLPQIWVTAAAGISMIIGLGAHQYIPSRDGKDAMEDALAAVAGSFIRPLFALFGAWLLTLVS